MTLQVLKAGALSTLQDLGRYGYQRYGVPVSGVMDEWSHRLANLLVGNAESEATLECTLTGPSLGFGRTHLIALCGADLSPTIGGVAVPQGRPVRVPAGARLDFGERKSGARVYLGIGGGFLAAPVMQSNSTFLRGGFGGFHGRALRKADVLDIGASHAERLYPQLDQLLDAMGTPFAAPAWSVIPPRAIGSPQPLRVMAGPQWDAFGKEAQSLFCNTPFRITPQSDRMGYRLEGARLALRKPLEMISEAVGFGTIQIPPDGNPIILMADRQTTGGYPKIADVASVDLPLLAQMLPSECLCFSVISLEAAQQLRHEREQELQRLRHSINQLKWVT